MQKTELDRLAIGLRVLFCTIWGLQQVAIKIASAGISPIWQAGLRSIGASVIVLLWSWLRGVRLFERSSRDFRLTQAGEALLPQAQALLDAAEKIKAGMKNAQAVK